MKNIIENTVGSIVESDNSALKAVAIAAGLGAFAIYSCKKLNVSFKAKKIKIFGNEAEDVEFDIQAEGK